MNMLTVYLVGIPVILFAVQLLLCMKVKSLFFRLVPVLLWLVSLATVLMLTFWVGWDIPGVYLNILLPRFLAVGLAWLIRYLLRKRIF